MMLIQLLTAARAPGSVCGKKHLRYQKDEEQAQLDSSLTPAVARMVSSFLIPTPPKTHGGGGGDGFLDNGKELMCQAREMENPQADVQDPAVHL